MTSFARGLRGLWRRRRWLFGAYLLYALFAIPRRTHFQFVVPACNLRVAAETVGPSLRKTPHIVLFGVFCALVLLQFDRVDRRSLAWSVVATTVLGAIIELEEGATRTGNCRLTDLLPDIIGAVSVAAISGAVVLALRARRGSQHRIRSN